MASQLERRRTGREVTYTIHCWALVVGRGCLARLLNGTCTRQAVPCLGSHPQENLEPRSSQSRQSLDPVRFPMQHSRFPRQLPGCPCRGCGLYMASFVAYAARQGVDMWGVAHCRTCFARRRRPPYIYALCIQHTGGTFNPFPMHPQHPSALPHTCCALRAEHSVSSVACGHPLRVHHDA